MSFDHRELAKKTFKGFSEGSLWAKWTGWSTGSEVAQGKARKGKGRAR